jgi:Rrf2 family protein
MKLITRDTDYAVRALCFIAKNERKVYSVRELVKELGIPRPFLRKIFQILGRHGIIRSYKGKGGGFSIGLSAGTITLMDLVEIFQGPVKLNDHTFKKKPCPHMKQCRLKKRLDAIEKEMVSRLRSITITSIL